nr:hypothetical protein [Candidatus Sigynarchaeota archaeon]
MKVVDMIIHGSLQEAKNVANADELKIYIEETKQENIKLSEQKVRLEHELQCIKNKEHAVLYCAVCGLDPYHPSTYNVDDNSLWVCLNANCKATVHCSCQKTLLRGSKTCPRCKYPLVLAEITPPDLIRAYKRILHQLDTFNKRQTE